jgi:hypothetical protein
VAAPAAFPLIDQLAAHPPDGKKIFVEKLPPLLFC